MKLRDESIIEVFLRSFGTQNNIFLVDLATWRQTWRSTGVTVGTGI